MEIISFCWFDPADIETKQKYASGFLHFDLK